MPSGSPVAASRAPGPVPVPSAMPTPASGDRCPEGRSVSDRCAARDVRRSGPPGYRRPAVSTRVGARLADSVRVFAALVRNRSLLRVELAFLAFNAVEYGTWIAILLFAYEATGPTSVGVVALAPLIPAPAVSPGAAPPG